jgi:hypothetical protein
VQNVELLSAKNWPFFFLLYDDNRSYLEVAAAAENRLATLGVISKNIQTRVSKSFLELRHYDFSFVIPISHKKHTPTQ